MENLCPGSSSYLVALSDSIRKGNYGAPNGQESYGFFIGIWFGYWLDAET